MISANIYSMEPLPEATRSAIGEGIDMVAEHIGDAIAAKNVRIKLATNKLGVVDPARVGFGKLDKIVELHLMAVPLNTDEDGILGVAGIGQGWAFTGINQRDLAVIRHNTAHEVAHAFGFVRKGSVQEDPRSQHHCISSQCVMHKSALTWTLEPAVSIQPRKRMPGLLRRPAMPELPVRSGLLGGHDFCRNCKDDMHEHGAANISSLRMARLTGKSPVGKRR